jgi:hypothetical protein
MPSLTCCSTISLMQVLSLISFLWSLANGCVLNVIEGVRIPCYANCIQIQTFQFLHVPWGASLFHLKHYFAVSIVFNFTWYYFVLNNIKEVMITCLCTLYFNSNRIFCAHTLRSFLILFRAPFQSYHNIFIQFVLWIIWLLSSFVEVYPSCYRILFAIFDPQYSLVSFIYLPLYMCMCFHLFLLDMHTVLEELTLYWPSKFFAHFGNGCQWGRSFEGLKEIGFYALVCS